MPTAVDLFSGAGGMSLGLEKAGFQVRAAFDNWGPAVETYNSNFQHKAYLRDVGGLSIDDLIATTGLGVGELDLLAGGPPCQGFSVQRIGDDTDPRNDLVLEFARIAAAYQPKMFLMENVPGLLGKRGRPTLAQFEKVTTEAGYSVSVWQITAADYGVAQNRRRILVVGSREDVPQPSQPSGLVVVTTVDDAFRGLPPASAPGTKDAPDPLHVQSKLSELNLQRLMHIPPGGGFEDLPVELRANCHKNGASKIGHRAVYGRLSGDRPAGVITARFDSFTRGRFAHPREHRNITLREGARLQSFPDEFVFKGNREEVAALIGNSVPPLVSRGVGSVLVDCLSVQAGFDASHARDAS